MHSVSYNALDPSKLRTLGKIIESMGHTGRTIDILRLDCEGCEWGVLKQLACSGKSQLMKHLMVDRHFQKNLGHANDDDILIAAIAIICLESECWGIASMEKLGCCPKDAQYIDSVLKFVRDPFFLQYITMKLMTSKMHTGSSTGIMYRQIGQRLNNSVRIIRSMVMTPTSGPQFLKVNMMQDR
ncbi:hypothetical protein ACHAW6_002966 [Cyclotella cf. meneghiniana]